MKKLLLLVGVSAMSVFAMGQNNVTVLKSNKISEFKNRMYVSTSKDPLAVMQADTIIPKELNSKKVFRTRTAKTKSLKSTSQLKALIDTAYTFPWVASTQQWDTIPVGKIIYTYDSQNNLTKYLSLTWNTTSLSWQNNIQIINSYNTSNQLMNVIQQNWKYKGKGIYAWVNNYQNFLTYDSTSRESNFIYQTWNVNKNKWINSWQHLYTYDSIGHNTTILEMNWNVSASQWILSYNYINQYDSLGNIVLNPIQIWDSSTWVNGAQTIYDYDIYGNNTSMLYQVWNSESGLWENSKLEIMLYTNLNKIDNYVIKLWDSSILDWYILQQGIYRYDSIGNNIEILNQDYDPISFSWMNNSENLYEYDSNNTQISDAILYWDSGPENWYSGTKTVKIINYNTVKSTTAKQNTNSNLASTFLEVYPNPASEFVNIQNNSSINQVKIFDMLGNEVLLKNYNGINSIQLDIANLKSGVYLLNIKNSDGTSITKKLMKR